MDLTERQEQILKLSREGFSQRRIAEKTGLSRWSVRDHLARIKNKDRDPLLQEVIDHFGSNEAPKTFWAKSGKFSALYGTKKPAEEDLVEKLQKAFENIPAAPIIPDPVSVDRDTMTLYPLFDVHLDLMAAQQVSGENTNLEVACERLKTNVAKVMANSPNSEVGVIVNGGDLNHTDDDLNVTPKHKHPLDSSSRNYTTIDASIEVICALIEMGLTKHETVEYYSVPGNHDPKNWVSIMMAVYNRYRDNPRVTVEKNPLEFSLVRFGDNLLVIHHGDKRAIKDMLMFLAAEYPEAFAGSRYRMLLTGHNHHLKAEDFPGWEWRQFRPITARDHHAFSNFYTSMSEVLSIVFHKDEGEKTGWKEKL